MNAPIMPPSTPPIAARQRQQVAELPDEVGHDDAPANDGAVAEGVERRPQHARCRSTHQTIAPSTPSRARGSSSIAVRTPADNDAGTVASCAARRASRRPRRPAVQAALEVGRQQREQPARSDHRRRRTSPARPSPRTAPAPWKMPDAQAEAEDRPARPCTRVEQDEEGDHPVRRPAAATCPSGASPTPSARCRPRRRPRTAASPPARPS